tara:strand:- start:315 stop:632 length:318 start_codon:yes stop_codon:yes gene_type:complete
MSEIKITRENLLDYLDGLLLLEKFPTQSFFVGYCKTRNEYKETKEKLGYTIDCPIDEYKLDRLKREINSIKAKIVAFDELDSVHTIKVQSKMNTQTNKFYNYEQH